MARKEYEELIASMPYGIEKAVMRVLENRIGKDNAITNAQIQAFIYSSIDLGDDPDRIIRKTVQSLRKKGVLIGSGEYGFFMIDSLKEWIDVKENKLLQPYKDILDTVRIMDAKAREKFGEGFQVSLGI